MSKQLEVDNGEPDESLNSVFSIYLHQKKAAEVALQPLGIYLTFESLIVLQVSYGPESVTQVTQELKYLWPLLILVHGKIGHSKPRTSRVSKQQHCRDAPRVDGRH